MDPALIVPDEQGNIAALVADADVCCLYQAEIECMWTGTFGVDGRQLVDHVLEAHTDQQSDEERPFFITDAAGARAFEDVIPAQEPRQNELLGIIGPAMGAAGLAGVIPLFDAAFAGDMVAVCAFIRNLMPWMADRMAAGNYIDYLNCFLNFWLHQVVRLLHGTLDTVPSQTQLFQHIVEQYQTELEASVDEMHSLERLQRVRGWVVEFDEAFAPLLPQVVARDHRGFYASRPGHPWFDPIHLRRDPGADPDLLLAAASIEEVCEELDLAQDAAHWDRWDRQIQMASMLARFPVELARAWSAHFSLVWRRTEGGGAIPSFEDFRPFFDAWFEHIPDRNDRLVLFNISMHGFLCTVITSIDAILPQYMEMVAGAFFPLIVQRIDPDGALFPNGFSVDALKAVLRHMVATRIAQYEDRDAAPD